MAKTRENTKNLVLAALFTAITAILSQTAIPIPGGVPLTLQTFAVALCGYVLGVKWGLASISAYVLLGAVGVPVFSGFKGGIDTLFGTTGGFIFGFILFALICGLSHSFKNRILAVLIGIGGMLVCHLCGVIQFSIVYGSNFINSFLLVSLPYLLKDALSVIAAYFLSVYILKLIKKI